jgi:TRAP-type uncharacterized transport system substrate-binding protein
MRNQRENYIKDIVGLLTKVYHEDTAQVKSVQSGLKKLNTNQLSNLYCLVLTSRG